MMSVDAAHTRGMIDLGRAFARATTFACDPWWRRLLRKPATTLVYPAALRLPLSVPFARQVSAQTFFEAEMLVVLPEESACQIFYDGIIEEDSTSFFLTCVTEGMTVIDVGTHRGYFTLQLKALWSTRTTRPFHEYGRRYSALHSVRNHWLIKESGLARHRSFPVECVSLDEYGTACTLASTEHCI
jgi:hypothetical protein